MSPRLSSFGEATRGCRFRTKGGRATCIVEDPLAASFVASTDGEEQLRRKAACLDPDRDAFAEGPLLRLRACRTYPPNLSPLFPSYLGAPFLRPARNPPRALGPASSAKSAKALGGFRVWVESTTHRFPCSFQVHRPIQITAGRRSQWVADPSGAGVPWRGP